MIKYIFSINTGRSGSNYLSNILQDCDNISAFHEPSPIMNGKPMIDFLKGNETLLKEQMIKKMSVINSTIDGNKSYLETNHTFIKGFGWIIPSLVSHEEIGVIFLKRNKNEIINSLYRINCTPLTYSGLTWIMNPLMKDPINKVPFYDKINYRILFFLLRLVNSKYNPFKIKFRKPNFVKTFELKYLDWYVEETYSQGERFKDKYPQIKIYETTINQLNNVEEFETMFNFFDLEFKPNHSFYEKMSIKINLKRSNTAE